MTTMKRFLSAALLTGLSLLGAQAQLSLHQQKADAEHLRLTLTNTSDKAIGADFQLYFSILPTAASSESEAVRVENVNGNYFRLLPTDAWTPLPAGASRELTLRLPWAMNKTMQLPEGWFFVGADGRAASLPCTTAPFADREYATGVAEAFRFNGQLPPSAPLSPCDIVPAVKRAATLPEGGCRLERGFTIDATPDVATEARLLRDKLTTVVGLAERAVGVSITLRTDASLAASVSADAASVSAATASPAAASEHYLLSVGKRGITITGATPHAVFDGTQTLLALLRNPAAFDGKTLAALTIDDAPDLPYRGVMLDISRNFTSYDNLLSLLDLLAQYKLNALHLHFADDEGWRIEIPGLPELTEVGGRRGYTTDERQCLYPGYDGHPDPSAPTSGNGYLTRQQFISLLRHAADRHISVMPEIESPGHARAAVVSMKARYLRYKDSNPARATEYLLSEEADTSRYTSVQAYHDNVMNIALPSTYRFMRKVIAELKLMYDEAGVPLHVLHLGGDEVAEGCWTGSPACQRLMQEKGLRGREELSSYFYADIIRYLDTLGVKYGGWQEISTAHRPLQTDYYRQRAGAVNCWTADTAITSRLADEGYPVLVSNVTRCYMDMASSPHPSERGLQWGGTVDEAVSFSLLPLSRRLSPQGRQHTLGVQGQLFAETIRGVGDVEYSLFPKILGLLERGWNAHPAWEQASGDEAARLLNADLATFYARLSHSEMPYWQRLGVHYRLPFPGLRVADGVLTANTPIVGAEIRYTTDGSDPTAASTLYTQPVALPQGATIVKARLFVGDRQSVLAVAPETVAR